MSRFAELKKIPKEPAARLLAAKSTKIETPLSGPASASVEDVLAELEGKRAWVDLMRVLAVALPEREAVWWACLAAHDLVGEGGATACMKAAEAWVFEPNTENREAIQQTLEAVETDDDTALVATAALYAPGNLGPGIMSEIAAPPSAVSACVFGMNMTVLGEVEDPMAHMQWLIERGLDIARGGNGRVDPPDYTFEPEPIEDDDEDEEDVEDLDEDV